MGEMTVEEARRILGALTKAEIDYAPEERTAIETLLSATEPKKPQEPFGWLTQQNPNAWGGPEQPWVFRKTMPSDAKGLCGLKPVFDDPVTEPRTVEQVAALLPDTHCVVPVDPTCEQWDGLARTIMLAFDMQCYTPRALLEHLRMSNKKVPQWLLDEPEMASLDHSMSKGTRCVIIYRAMLAAGAVRGEGE